MNTISATFTRFRDDYNALWIEHQQDRITEAQFGAMLTSVANEAACDLFRLFHPPPYTLTALAVAITELALSLSRDIAMQPGIYHLEGAIPFERTIDRMNQWEDPDDGDPVTTQTDPS
jgi:hypothetical protein